MTNIQRMKSDIATIDKRETADRTMSNNRSRNDDLTIERRSKADKTLMGNRLRNDELTVHRRDIRDGNQDMVLAISLVLIVLAVGTFFVFI